MKIEIAIENTTKGLKSKKVVSIELSADGLMIGRNSKDLSINDRRVSAKHLFIFSNSAVGLGVIDLASSNGTYLDGTKIERGTLKVGSCIRMGSTTLTFLKIGNTKGGKPLKNNQDVKEVVNAWPNLWLAVPSAAQSQFEDYRS